MLLPSSVIVLFHPNPPRVTFFAVEVSAKHGICMVVHLQIGSGKIKVCNAHTYAEEEMHSIHAWCRGGELVAMDSAIVGEGRRKEKTLNLP
jgi:hypothetical protein